MNVDEFRKFLNSPDKYGTVSKRVAYLNGLDGDKLNSWFVNTINLGRTDPLPNSGRQGTLSYLVDLYENFPDALKDRFKCVISNEIDLFDSKTREDRFLPRLKDIAYYIGLGNEFSRKFNKD